MVLGKLSVQYKSPTKVTVKNDLAETFKKAKIKLQAPISMGDLQPTIKHIITKRQENDDYHYEIGFTLPAKSRVNITLQ